MNNKEIEKCARSVLSNIEIKKMEHCIGYEPEKVYCRGKGRYYKPYRNHFDPGGDDIPVWEHLKEKGLANCNSRGIYWINHSGLNMLSAIKKVYIYSENARGNEIDASEDVIETLLDDAVFCGYGCWIPSGSKSIAIRSRLPVQLTRETLKYLQEKEYVKHVYEGGSDDDGFPYCTHGWVLSKKWKDEHKERYDAAQKAEYKRMDEILAKGVK